MWIELPLDVDEIIGQQQPAFGLEPVECSADQPGRALGALGPTDVAEHHQVVVVVLDHDLVEVPVAELAPVGHTELGRLDTSDIDHAG